MSSGLQGSSTDGFWPDRPFAEVAVDVPTDRPGRRSSSPVFTYAVPAELRSRIGPGNLVTVPFGPRRVHGVVTRITCTTTVESVREIAKLVEPRPVLSVDLVLLAAWMSLHYMAPRFACLRAMLPPGVQLTAKRRYRRTDLPIVATDLRPEHLAVLGAFGRRRSLDYAAIRRQSRLRDPSAELARLVADGLLEVVPGRGKARVGAKTELEVSACVTDAAEVREVLDAVRAGTGPPDEVRSARRKSIRRHQAVMDLLLAAGSAMPWRVVAERTGAGDRTRADLVQAGLLRELRSTVWRDPLSGRAPTDHPAPNLTEDQQAALDKILPLLGQGSGSWSSRRALLDARVRPSAEFDPAGAARQTEPPPACLVHGVTGSGKTELYLRAIEHVVSSRRQAIVLVPEISLTAQTVQRFAERFPGRTGVWHSRLTPGQRIDTWHRARDGLLDVVVGSRSALFAPLPRLGLIVLDEEHADSFKQAMTPRYHARDTALRRAALCGCAVLLGSATPSIETYHASRRGLAHRVELPRRIATGGRQPGWGPLPDVRVVDMRRELRSGNRSIFSRDLAGALLDTVRQGRQAMLFLNRRGSATSVSCRDCGHVIECKRCRLPLTAHGASRLLRCHHCNHVETTPMLCPACGSDRIKTFGVGTERVEEEARKLLGDARVLRWDADTTRRRNAHEDLLRSFASGQADVLVGTQMIAKGLDLPMVTLVGVVSADTSLHLPDIWTRERTFQTLTQVAGRAGRSILGGQVIFQTYRPDDASIRFAALHDYAAFYDAELAYRRANGYPPFRRVVRFELFTSASDGPAQQRAAELADTLRTRVGQLGLGETDVVGPAPAFFSRVRGKNRWQVVVYSEDPYVLAHDLQIGSGWRVDVDPVSLL